MRRTALAVSAALILGGAAWAVHAYAGVPRRGQLTLMRDGGGCVIGENEGVRLDWTEAGATLTSVRDHLELGEIGSGASPSWVRTVGRGRPFPLDRARALARSFGRALTWELWPVRQFAQASVGVQLTADGEERTGRLDCRDDFGSALKWEAENGDVKDTLRSAAFRLGLWAPRGKTLEPVVAELMADLGPPGPPEL